MPNAHGSVTRRQVQRRPVAPMAFPLDPILRPPAYTRRFETTETLGTGEGMGDGETRGSEARKRRKIGEFEGAMPSCWCSLGFRQVPCVAVTFRGVPQWPIVPIGLSHRSYISPASQRQCFETTETLGIGDGGRERENGGGRKWKNVDK